jgi:hypothetical protein
MTVVELQAKKSQVSKFQKDYYNNIKKSTEKQPSTIIVKNKPFEKVAKEPVQQVTKTRVKSPEKVQGDLNNPQDNQQK